MLQIVLIITITFWLSYFQYTVKKNKKTICSCNRKSCSSVKHVEKHPVSFSTGFQNWYHKMISKEKMMTDSQSKNY